MNMHLDEYSPPGEDIVGFGPFQLNRTKRVLTKGGRPIAMGSRAMEILLALTEQAGAILSHRELLRRVWPNIIVEDGTVRVHVALLRKVLRQAAPNSDYVHNVTGRGYSFVAPITRQRRAAEPPGMHSANSTVLKLPLRVPSRRNNLPHLITSVIGREKTTRALAERVTRERFVTVTGPGGSGKTVVAIVAANSLAPAHANGVCFVDLATVKRPQELWSMLASALGLSAEADPLPEILASLSRQSMLMVLDNCEHWVDIASHLAESVLQSCPQVNILATSREPLRASREFVYELTPLELPAAFDRVSRKDLMEYPAIQLFVERAGSYAGTPLQDEELWLVADVCRRSAGNPLAIEISASQVRWLGLKALSTGLQDAMYLSIEGRRTAERRHRTLRASFEWSYGLLSNEEQAVFRRLSVFAGSFNPDRVATVIADERVTHRIVLECLFSLARKSLIIANATHAEVLYRLDDLTRTYAAEKLQQAQEFPFTHRRHSQMWRRVGVEQIQAHARLWRSAQH